jgi:hypothetical protein
MLSLSRPLLIAAMSLLSAGFAEAGASIRIYTLPQQDGYLLSACLNNGDTCGKPIADAWCQSNGYREALTFERERREAVARVLNSSAFCDGPVCETFRQIKCYTPASTQSAAKASATANN